MGRRRSASDLSDPDTGRKPTRREIQEWRDKGRKVWWYIVRTDSFPYSYWKGEMGWGSSFRDYAAKYRTRQKAESVALQIAAKHPELLGKIDVIER